MNIKHRPWDSRFFGIDVGELSVAKWVPAVSQIISEPSIPDLIYLRIIECDEESLVRLKQLSSNWVNQITFEKPLRGDTATVAKVEIVAPSAISEDLISLAILAGGHSRFSNDPRLEAFFEPLYREWLVKSFTGELADKVLTYRVGEKDCGLVTISVDSNKAASIGLLSVSPEVRGKGIASAILKAAESWAAQNDALSMSIVTQMSNSAAVKFYQKEEYSIVHSEHIFHLWKEDVKRANPV